MEQVVVGILMLASFCLGAYIRDPFITFNRNKKKAENEVIKQSVSMGNQQGESMLKPEDDEDEERVKQVLAMWNYNESDALRKVKEDD